MTAPTDRDDDSTAGAPSELDMAYARASRADGSRPSSSTRASILTHAQRLTPAVAANDAWWNWRAVAGLAGVAFAGVLALWLYRGNPEPLPLPQSASLPTPPLQPLAPAPSPTAPTAPSATADTAAAVGALEKAVVTAPAAPATPAEAIAVAAPRLLSSRQSVRAEPALTARMAAPSADALLQRWFPQALDSDAEGLQYWFLLTRDGEVLRSGQRAWTDLPALQRWLEGADAGMRIARMESAHVMNRRGRDVELAYAWAASDQGTRATSSSATSGPGAPQ